MFGKFLRREVVRIVFGSFGNTDFLSQVAFLQIIFTGRPRGSHLHLSLFLLIAPNGQASKKLTPRLPSQRKGGQIILFAERGMIII